MKKWQKSSSSNKCKICDKRLVGGIINSDKVHCRVCGAIVCQECSQRTARYLPILEGTPVINGYPKYIAMHVCDRCYKDPAVLFIEEVCPKEASAEVKKLYAFAKNILIQVNRDFPVSASRQKYFGDYDPNLHVSKNEKNVHEGDSWYLMRNYSTEVHDSSVGKITRLEKIIQHSLKTSIGNCYEMALYGYLAVLYATQTGYLHVTSYGVYELPLGDHVFFLIAPVGEIVPPGTSNSYNFEKPHSNIIVCDPWRKMLFFLRSMNKYMGMTVIKNIPHYTMYYGTSYFTKYHSMSQLQDSIFKHPHSTTED